MVPREEKSLTPIEVLIDQLSKIPSLMPEFEKRIVDRVFMKAWTKCTPEFEKKNKEKALKEKWAITNDEGEIVFDDTGDAYTIQLLRDVHAEAVHQATLACNKAGLDPLTAEKIHAYINGLFDAQLHIFKFMGAVGQAAIIRNKDGSVQLPAGDKLAAMLTPMMFPQGNIRIPFASLTQAAVSLDKLEDLTMNKDSKTNGNLAYRSVALKLALAYAYKQSKMQHRLQENTSITSDETKKTVEAPDQKEAETAEEDLPEEEQVKMALVRFEKDSFHYQSEFQTEEELKQTAQACNNYLLELEQQIRSDKNSPLNKNQTLTTELVNTTSTVRAVKNSTRQACKEYLAVAAMRDSLKKKDSYPSFIIIDFLSSLTESRNLFSQNKFQKFVAAIRKSLDKKSGREIFIEKVVRPTSELFLEQPKPSSVSMFKKPRPKKSKKKEEGIEMINADEMKKQ